jgi:hypothetical protein
MSLRRAWRRGLGQHPGNAAAYRRHFVTTVHRIVAAGFQRLHLATLATKEETEITGLLVGQMREVVESRESPEEWRLFAIHDDRPEGGDGVEGKCRPRIDVFAERTWDRPRPRFCFEAKRLNHSGSAAAYVGDEGLGRFLSGKYAKNDSDAGMLGYVQIGTPGDWAAKIERKLDQERAAHGLDATGQVWHPESLVPSLTHSYTTTHTRNGHPFQVFHVLLACA